MPDIEYVNPQIKNIVQQEISIQIGLNGFSFLIKEPSSSDCLLFRHYKFSKINLLEDLIRKVEEVLSKDKNLSQRFGKATITYTSQLSTLIPAEFFVPEHLKKYFEFNHNLNELDMLQYSKLEEIGAYNVFSIPSYLANSFYEYYSNVSFEHQSSALIKFGARSKNYPNSIIVSINTDFFDIAIFEQNKLLLYNSFQYTNPLDFIYFFLYPLSQLKIDAKTLPTLVFGQTSSHKEILKEIKKNVKEVIFPPKIGSITCRQLSQAQILEFYSLFI